MTTSKFFIRRRLIRTFPGVIPIGSTLASIAVPANGAPTYPPVTAGTSLSFPRDFGAHPQFRTEWWYLTAWLETRLGFLGLQLTFFRSRTPFGRQNPSRLAARQLMFAHAAIADPQHRRLIHAEQAWRGGSTTAQFSETDTGVQLGRPGRRWSLQRRHDDVYVASVLDPLFDLELQAIAPSHNPVLQGDNGFSLKGVHPEQASHYYSRPQLALKGTLTLKSGKTASARLSPVPFTGKGWLDHEWSSELLDASAQGWDWVGINFSDGRSLMAFQMRNTSGGVLKSTARLIHPDGSQEDLPVRFSALDHWTSPRTNARYPVAMRVQLGSMDLRLDPIMKDQELDSTRSTGTVYWEGAVQVTRYTTNKNPGQSVIGRGYLEMTGYANKIRL